MKQQEQSFQNLIKKTGASPDDLIAQLEIWQSYLTDSHKAKLLAIGSPKESAPDASKALNLKEQVHKLWNTVDILLNQEVDYANQTLKNPENHRNATDIVAKATTLANLLAKLYEDVTNQSVLHQTEMATIAALKKFPELYENFLAELKIQLNNVE